MSHRVGAADDVPLLVMEEDGSLMVISIPRMSGAEFEFFLMLLDLYKRVIIKPSPPPTPAAVTENDDAP